jgi:hypothetical protein
MIIKLPIIEDNKIIYELFRLYREDNLIYLISNFKLKNNINNIKLVKNINDNIISESEKINITNTSSNIESNNIESNNDFNYELENNKLNTTISGINLLKIIACNDNGINYFNLFVPLKFYIINDKYVWNIHFIQTSFLSKFKNINIDFINILNNYLIKYFNLEILSINNLKLNEKIIWKIINNEYNLITKNDLNNLEDFNIHFWNNLNVLFNSALYILYHYSQTPHKKLKEFYKKYDVPKKVIYVFNIIKVYTFSINLSNHYTFNEHLNFINKTYVDLDNIEITKNYFLIINNNKYLLININNINNNTIICNNLIELDYNKYKILYYPPNINIIINDLIIILLNDKKILYELKNNNLEKDILNYFIEKSLNSNLYSLIINSEFEIIKSNNYSKDFFIKIIMNNFNNANKIIILLKILFNNYIYPIKFNKMEIDDNFDDILFLSLFNIKFILNIENNIQYNDKNKLFLRNEINNLLPIKIKLLYFNLIKIFYIIIYHNDENDLLSIKYFQESIHKNFIKIFFNNTNKICNSFKLLKELIKTNNKDPDIIISKIKNIIKTFYLLIDVTNKLSWANLSNRLSYLSILINNNNYLLYKDKFNKLIFGNNIDIRLKNIIINPFEMFKYLRKENDFYKWLKFLGIKCINLYNIPISLSSDDFLNLGKIIYNLLNVKEQNMKDKIYVKFIQYCTKYPKLILDDTNRINLKIKDYFSFTSCNINLGILAKQLSLNNNFIDLNLDEEIDTEIIKLQNKLQCVTKKYIKYKKKYINIINNINNSIKLSETS